MRFAGVEDISHTFIHTGKLKHNHLCLFTLSRYYEFVLLQKLHGRYAGGISSHPDTFSQSLIFPRAPLFSFNPM